MDLMITKMGRNFKGFKELATELCLVMGCCNLIMRSLTFLTVSHNAPKANGRSLIEGLKLAATKVKGITFRFD